MEKKYTQKFRKEWINNPKLKEWISECKDPEKAYCKYCKCEINAKLYALNAHAESRKHVNAVERLGITNPLPYKPVSMKTQQQEASLCMFLAVHSSIATIDHLGEVCRNRLECSSLKLHRTKCSNIIKNVIGPHFDDELRKDIGEGQFSILIDESCDVALTKILGLAIIYYSNNFGKIVSTFLSIEELDSGSAESIVIGVKNALKKFNLNIEKLVGIGTDNANVMIGKNKSVHAALKKDIPQLILVKCVCHSLQLAVNQSLKEYLPDQLEFLVHETYSWYSKSSKRQVAYKTLYRNLNEKDPLKIPKTSETRWLSIETSVSRILSQWEELKVHFETAYVEEKCHKAKLLSDMYNEDNIRLYLLFLKPVLLEVQVVNKIFQGHDNDPTRLLKEVLLLINFLKRKVVGDDNVDVLYSNFDEFILYTCSLGHEFETYLKEIKENGKIKKKGEREIRRNCVRFVVDLINQLKQRLPDNIKILQNIEYFSVDNILKSSKDDIIPILKLFAVTDDISSKIKEQYENIHYIKWINIKNTILFWSEVYKYRDAGGNFKFKEISEFALKLLSLPWSNAEVERVFSQINLVKTNLRNKLNLTTVNSILTIRFGLKRIEKCCHDYEVPNNYLKLIGTNEAYDQNNNNNNNDDYLDDCLL